jgi:23S rRNA pseudouridine1911/1915/1917 synthase
MHRLWQTTLLIEAESMAKNPPDRVDHKFVEITSPNRPAEPTRAERLEEVVVQAVDDKVQHIGDDAVQDDLFEHHKVIVDRGQSLLRIDKFLFDRLPGNSRNRIQNAIKAESVRVNGKAIKSSYLIKPLDVIQIVLAYPPRDTTLQPEAMDLEIPYEDPDLLLVNKPPGLVVHPGHGHHSGTLVNGLLHHFNGLPTHRNGEVRPGLVHRIDKDTSGLLVIAKTEYAMTHLARQFFDHSIDRTYQALVWGSPAQDSGTVRTQIDRDPRNRLKMAAFLDEQRGKHAVTHYEVIERLGYVSLLQFRLETGRTHQIRVHTSFLGHPIFNDSVYGGDRVVVGPSFSKYRQFVENAFAIMPRMALHARSLGFIHPETGQKLAFESDLPADFSGVLEKWRRFAGSSPDSWALDSP